MSDTESAQVTRATVGDVLRALDLDQLGPRQWRGISIPSEGPVVAGAQMIGQAVVAASATAPDKRVKSIHSVFARTGRADQPVTLDVAPLHDGRSFGSLTVTVSQGERQLAQSLVLLDTPEADVIRHASEAPTVIGPDEAFPKRSMLEGWEQRETEDVDLFDPATVGPPQLRTWSRFDVEPQAPAVVRALVSWASVGSFIGAAMRPHEGVGLSQAHRTLSTGVLTHAMTFHDDAAAEKWLLLSLTSVFAGGGRAYGTGEVFTRDGRLVASCTQESMIRQMAPSRSGL